MSNRILIRKSVRPPRRAVLLSKKGRSRVSLVVRQMRGEEDLVSESEEDLEKSV